MLVAVLTTNAAVRAAIPWLVPDVEAQYLDPEDPGEVTDETDVIVVDVGSTRAGVDLIARLRAVHTELSTTPAVVIGDSSTEVPDHTEIILRPVDLEDLRLRLEQLRPASERPEVLETDSEPRSGLSKLLSKFGVQRAPGTAGDALSPVPPPLAPAAEAEPTTSSETVELDDRLIEVALDPDHSDGADPPIGDEPATEPAGWESAVRPPVEDAVGAPATAESVAEEDDEAPEVVERGVRSRADRPPVEDAGGVASEDPVTRPRDDEDDDREAPIDAAPPTPSPVEAAGPGSPTDTATGPASPGRARTLGRAAAILRRLRSVVTARSRPVASHPPRVEELLNHVHELPALRDPGAVGRAIASELRDRGASGPIAILLRDTEGFRTIGGLDLTSAQARAVVPADHPLVAFLEDRVGGLLLLEGLHGGTALVRGVPVAHADTTTVIPVHDREGLLAIAVIGGVGGRPPQLIAAMQDARDYLTVLMVVGAASPGVR